MTQLQMDTANPVFKIGYLQDDEFRNNLYQINNTRANIKKIIQTAGVVVTALFAPSASVGNPVHHYPSYSTPDHGFRVQNPSGRLEIGKRLINNNQDVVNVFDYSYTVTKPNYSGFSLGTGQEAIELEIQQPSLFEYEKTIKSKVVKAGFFEPTLGDDFGETPWDDLEDDSQLFKFEKQIKSKVVYGGDFEFPPLD